jgi:hypothetical protein
VFFISPVGYVSSFAGEKPSFASDKANFNDWADKNQKVEISNRSLEWNVFCLPFIIGNFLYAFYADGFQIQEQGKVKTNARTIKRNFGRRGGVEVRRRHFFDDYYIYRGVLAARKMLKKAKVKRQKAKVKTKSLLLNFAFYLLPFAFLNLIAPF